MDFPYIDILGLLIEVDIPTSQADLGKEKAGISCCKNVPIYQHTRTLTYCTVYLDNRHEYDMSMTYLTLNKTFVHISVKYLTLNTTYPAHECDIPCLEYDIPGQ